MEGGSRWEPLAGGWDQASPDLDTKRVIQERAWGNAPRMRIVMSTPALFVVVAAGPQRVSGPEAAAVRHCVGGFQR